MVRFHCKVSRATRLATLHNSAMLDPSHPDTHARCTEMMRYYLRTRRRVATRHPRPANTRKHKHTHAHANSHTWRATRRTHCRCHIDKIRWLGLSYRIVPHHLLAEEVSRFPKSAPRVALANEFVSAITRRDACAAARHACVARSTRQTGGAMHAFAQALAHHYLLHGQRQRRKKQL